MNLTGFSVEEKIVLLASRADFNEVISKKIEEIVKSHFVDWDRVVGIMVSNRLNGVIFDHLSGTNYFPQKTMQLLKLLYLGQKEVVKVQADEIGRINNLLSEHDVQVCFLKGAVLNTIVYKVGTRISSDTDLLVREQDIEECNALLKKMGYIQGSIENNEIIPANRHELLFAQLNTYELVPFHKKMNNSFLPVHTVDVNYRLSNSENVEAAEELLLNKVFLENDLVSVKTMDLERFFIFLCIHLYREATMVFKIMEGEDLSVYKFMDIHFLAIKYKSRMNYSKMYDICIKINKNKEVYYAMYHTELLYPGTFKKSTLDQFEPQNLDYLNEYHGRDNTDQTYKWESEFVKRVFDRKRILNAKKNIGCENERYNNIIKEIRK